MWNDENTSYILCDIRWHNKFTPLPRKTNYISLAKSYNLNHEYFRESSFSLALPAFVQNIQTAENNTANIVILSLFFTANQIASIFICNLIGWENNINHTVI